MCAHVDIEPRAESLRRLYEKPFVLFDNASDVIGEAAVGIRNVFPLFKQDDFRFFGVPADAGGGCGASGHSAYDDNLHVVIYFFVIIFRWKLLQK